MRNFRGRWGKINHTRKTTGKRSGLEVKVAAQLDGLNIPYEYEQDKLEYTKPTETKTYTPDFRLPNGIYIETKGEFTSGDRKKHLLIQVQRSEDIRFVFSNPHQPIAKKSKTTYAQWCAKHGFLYAKGTIPEEWLREKGH